MARTQKPAAAPAEEVTKDAPAKPSFEKLTSFRSHGLAYYRMTIPRDVGERYVGPLNGWEFAMDEKTGVITLTPVRELVENK